jgi:hypothetical protein
MSNGLVKFNPQEFLEEEELKFNAHTLLRAYSYDNS